MHDLGFEMISELMFLSLAPGAHQDLIRISSAWMEFNGESGWRYSHTSPGIIKARKATVMELQQVCCVYHGWAKPLRNCEIRVVRGRGDDVWA